ncbi:hypothetical protein AL065_07415 [Pseudomonas amygdali pv. ulmi]|nr:hypothetical protein AL065_07415 [Pseudomonas amygdali pv. ulmi]
MIFLYTILYAKDVPYVFSSAKSQCALCQLAFQSRKVSTVGTSVIALKAHTNGAQWPIFGAILQAAQPIGVAWRLR